jgi:FtsZ-interacting cell division protein ZipA
MKKAISIAIIVLLGVTVNASTSNSHPTRRPSNLVPKRSRYDDMDYDDMYDDNDYDDDYYRPYQPRYPTKKTQEHTSKNKEGHSHPKPTKKPSTKPEVPAEEPVPEEQVPETPTEETTGHSDENGRRRVHFCKRHRDCRSRSLKCVPIHHINGERIRQRLPIGICQRSQPPPPPPQPVSPTEEPTAEPTEPVP